MKKQLLNHQSLETDLAILFLRLIFGGMFMHYGYTKLMLFDEILPMFTDYIGIGSKTSLILVIFAELICGFFVTIGLLTRMSVIPIFITMIVAFFIAHAKDPFDVKQVAFIFLLLSIVIFIFGSGKYSVDKFIIRS